jgi:hypothetical protein
MANQQENKSITTKYNVYEQPGYFQFPFTPYDIQVKFMQKLYVVLESGGVGIFESPTGTVSGTTSNMILDHAPTTRFIKQF